MSKKILDSEYEEPDRVDCNASDFWDTFKVTRTDDVVILETVATWHDLTVTHKPPNVDQNNEEISFTNHDLIALSNRRHE